jgi:hypothetical protein
MTLQVTPTPATSAVNSARTQFHYGHLCLTWRSKTSLTDFYPHVTHMFPLGALEAVNRRFIFVVPVGNLGV